MATKNKRDKILDGLLSQNPELKRKYDREAFYQSVVESIQSIMEDQGVPELTIANVLGIHEEHLHRKFSGSKDLTLRDIILIGEFLNVKVKIDFKLGKAKEKAKEVEVPKVVFEVLDKMAEEIQDNRASQSRGMSKEKAEEIKEGWRANYPSTARYEDKVECIIIPKGEMERAENKIRDYLEYQKEKEPCASDCSLSKKDAIKDDLLLRVKKAEQELQEAKACRGYALEQDEQRTGASSFYDKTKEAKRDKKKKDKKSQDQITFLSPAQEKNFKSAMKEHEEVQTLFTADNTPLPPLA